jgi:hypothetical protein
LPSHGTVPAGSVFVNFALPMRTQMSELEAAIDSTW